MQLLRAKTSTFKMPMKRRLSYLTKRTASISGSQLATVSYSGILGLAIGMVYVLVICKKKCGLTFQISKKLLSLELTIFIIFHLFF